MLRTLSLSALLLGLSTCQPATADPLPTCHLPNAQAATCVHVARDATAGQWVLWHLTDGTAVRGRTYPILDGGPVPGLDPTYRWLLALRVEPPAIDSRLQVIPYPCPETPDWDVGTLTATCTAQVRPAAELCGAAHNVAQARIAAALDATGLSDPADQYRAIALLTARVGGQTLSPEQSAWLAATGEIGIDYVDDVREVQTQICAWIEAHPGEMPDLGDDVWPPLPTAAE